jgi:hypothetical protein
MPDEKPQNETPPSLRDIAEAAYDDLEAGAEAAEAAEAPEPSEGSEAPETVASDDRPRDKQGRWVAKSGEPQPGEAIEPLDPAPKRPKVSETQTAPTTPDPAATGAKQSGPPEHWSAEDKATFAKLPAEGQAFLLKRHGDMEAEFTRKSQASAGAVQFTQALAPVFNDPAIMQDLQRSGVNPVQAVHLWGQLHRRAISPKQEDRFGVLVEMTQRMGLDPARIFAALQNQPPPLPEGISPEDLKDPAIRFFADQFGRTTTKLQALEGQLQQRAQAEQQAREEWQVKSARQGIDGFADEKTKDGQPLRPYFDAVLPIIIDLYKANPRRDIREAYDTACWAHPEVRKQLLAAEQYRSQSKNDLQKARIAQRGNARGLTAPVARPNGADGPSKGSLRDAIERSADEIGL